MVYSRTSCNHQVVFLNVFEPRPFQMCQALLGPTPGDANLTFNFNPRVGNWATNHVTSIWVNSLYNIWLYYNTFIYLYIIQYIYISG